MLQEKYARIGDVNKAILGIKPRVTLEQANLIAEWADAIAEDSPDGAWPIAISRFKKSYTVRGGKWVERAKAKEQEDAMPMSMTFAVDGEQVAVDRLIEVYRASLQEQKKKTVDGEKFPPGDFLVVEDPESPSTWHLQVKKNDKPDRRLMGAAKAALTSPGGHRGEKYAGPDKSGAIRKLKALYKAEGMEFGEADVEEYDGEEPMIVQGPTTFADLIARKSARKAADEIYELTYQFQMLANNVMGSADVTDKVAALKALATEYMTMVEAAMASVQTGAPTEETAAEISITEDSGVDSVVTGDDADKLIAEFAEIVNTEIAELDSGSPRRPVVVDMRIIKAGPGNKKDGHYYPGDILRRDAKVFENADIFITNHKDGERGEKTKVGRIREIVRIEEDGSPIGRSVIYDPDMAEKTRNRAVVNELGTLHCSIFGNGQAVDGTVDGKKYKVVTKLNSVPFVEFVSRHGAGGEAISLVESADEQPSAEGGDPVDVQEQEQGQKIKTEGQETVTEVVQVESQPVTISEAAPVAPTKPIAEAAPVTETLLSEADVIAELNKRPALHPAIRIRVGAIPYHDLAEFNAALDCEIAYYKQLTGSGSPFAQGAQQGEKPLTAAERDARGKERFNRIMREVGSNEV